MHIFHNFDGGNIDVISCTDPQNITLAIKKDNASDFLQWFSFRLYAPKGTKIHIHIVNAHETSYPQGWEGYQARYSYDEKNWLQTHTEYDGVLHIHHIMQQDSVSFAYFAPYTLVRHQKLIRWAQNQGAELHSLGSTIQGRSMDMLRVGNGSKQLWCVARQHPGETMAEWWMEGFCEHLLNPSDPIAQQLRSECTLHIVPNMNPDGGFLGNLRTNAAGANLNREWKEPTLAYSPEVLCVREEMEKTGVDFALDVHGDEGLPYNFFAGPEGIPTYTPKKQHVFHRYEELLLARSPDFQTTYGYGKTKPGQANLTMCSNYIAEYFDCVAITIEQPFKDSAITPMPEVGWSPQRAKIFGSACLAACLPLIKDL